MPNNIVGRVKAIATDSGIEVTEEEIQKHLRSIAVKEVTANKVLSYLLDAFALVETHSLRVSDVVVSSKYYNLLSKYASTHMDKNTHKEYLYKGFFATLWGANIWVLSRAEDINCYPEESDTLKEDYPEIHKAKEELKR
jgi:methyltransferase-like protein